jgi:hypothetical protein
MVEASVRFGSVKGSAVAPAEANFRNALVPWDWLLFAVANSLLPTSGKFDLSLLADPFPWMLSPFQGSAGSDR